MMFNKEAIQTKKELQRNWEEKLAQLYKEFKFKGTIVRWTPLSRQIF